MSGLSLLRSVADSYGATHLNDNGPAAGYAVQPPQASGAPGPTYLVRISETSGFVVAHEQEPRRLPGFCPERHISFGGAFCLYWAEAEPMRIEDATAADAWWGKLTLFLWRQPLAQKHRRWPGKGDARAHGEIAARFQARAEAAAQRLGTPFELALNRECLTTARRAQQSEHRVRLLLDGKRIATVLEEAGRPMTLRSRCPCTPARKRPLKSCGSHAAAITELTLAIDGWQRAEREFFNVARTAGMVCCGTIDGCPLAQDSPPVARRAARCRLGQSLKTR